MRQRLLLITAAALATAACADAPLQPAERPGIRPSASIGCDFMNPVVVGPISGVGDTVAAGSPVTIGATVTDTAGPVLDGSVVSISWGDGAPIDSATTAGGAISASHSYAAPGTYQIVAYNDCSSYQIVFVTIGEPGDGEPGDGEPGGEEPEEEVPPTSGTYDLDPDPVPVGSEVPVTVTYEGGNTPTAEVDWGDGTVDTVTVTDGTPTTVTHVYETPGVYPVTVTSGGTPADPNAGTLVPVYDPSGGFVTGGGWVDTPASSYPSDAALAGKATFGLVVKTKKNQVIPEGNVEFQFHPAKMNFKSRGFDWLVVVDRKSTFQGYGTVNGSGDYGFLIVTSDGGRDDTFRMKIWNRATGAVVYDNEMGASVKADATTPLTQGNIVVHNK